MVEEGGSDLVAVGTDPTPECLVVVLYRKKDVDAHRHKDNAAEGAVVVHPTGPSQPGAVEPGRPGVQEHDRETQGRSRKAGAGETQGRASTKSEGEAAPKVEKEQPLAKQQRLRER